MSNIVSRRKWLTAGLTAAGGVAGLSAAAKLADRYGLIPPDWGGVWGPGETLTYACQRAIVTPHAMAREFNRSEVSKVAPVSGKPPKTDPYQRLLAGKFADWRIAIDGLVTRPAGFSLAELKRFPASTQITEQTCEEGWSFVAEWTGVRFSHVLSLVGVQPHARYVAAFSYDDGYDSLDMQDALHAQTLIAYGMNGRELTPDYGAPVRLKVPRQLGYKSLKFLSRLTVTDSMKNIGKGLGSWQPEGGYSWYAGI